MKRCASAQKNIKKSKSSSNKQATSRKAQAMRHKQQASDKRLSKKAIKIHEAWAYQNGYRAQAPRHKLRQNVARYNASDYKDSSVKPQAS